MWFQSETVPKFLLTSTASQKADQASAKIRSSRTNRDREIMEKVDNDSESVKEELAECQHLLDDMHAEHGRQEIFNFSLLNLDTKEISKKLNEVFASFNCAAKINIALGFLLQNIEKNDYRYFIRMKITHCWTEFFCYGIKTIY